MSAGETPFCRRCLLREFADGKQLYELIREYVEAIPAEQRAAPEVYAARLAARFSKGGNSSQVPVDYTRRKYVKKPGGAKPGFVIYTHQHTLYVMPAETEASQA